jgi:cell wall-associated NlpC family hydrolase
MLSPAQADPSTVAEAQAELNQYEAEAAAAEQAYHDTHDQYVVAQDEADAIRQEIEEQAADVAQLREQVTQIALQRYQSQGMDTPLLFFTSDDSSELLYQVSASQRLTSNTNDLIQRYQVEQGALADKRARLEAISLELQAADTRMAELQAQAQAQAAQARAALQRLQAAEAREAELRRRANAANNSAAIAVAPAFVSDGSAAGAVVAFALSKVGGPYVWGGNGPSGFDCSGLTRAAYLQVGISLPHNAASQMGYGAPVSLDALQPGDLLFYYSPVGHVAVYIGGGQIVHASTYGVGIVVSSATSIPITGARRLV